MPKKASDIVADSQKKAGKVRKQVMLGPEDAALMEKLKAEYGTITNVVVEGMRALDGRNDLSKAEVLAWIERNAPD